MHSDILEKMKRMRKITTTDDAIDVLFDGNKDEMEALRCPRCGSPYTYIYSSKSHAMDVNCSCGGTVMIKLYFEPNCVKIFGNSHDFNQ
jgi:DNA-directed RNA polymerase subunit RPC12/RpoP